jgi:hypothetical protein
MKSLILALALTFTLPVFAAETEKVCIKNSAGKETCKIIKVHKKLEGTKVPEPKKK